MQSNPQTTGPAKQATPNLINPYYPFFLNKAPLKKSGNKKPKSENGFKLSFFAATIPDLA